MLNRFWQWLKGLFCKKGYKRITVDDLKETKKPKKLSRKEKRAMWRSNHTHRLRRLHFGTFRPAHSYLNRTIRFMKYGASPQSRKVNA